MSAPGARVPPTAYGLGDPASTIRLALGRPPAGVAAPAPAVSARAHHFVHLSPDGADKFGLSTRDLIMYNLPARPKPRKLAPGLLADLPASDPHPAHALPLAFMTGYGREYVEGYHGEPLVLLGGPDGRLPSWYGPPGPADIPPLAAFRIPRHLDALLDPRSPPRGGAAERLMRARRAVAPGAAATLLPGPLPQWKVPHSLADTRPMDADLPPGVITGEDAVGFFTTGAGAEAAIRMSDARGVGGVQASGGDVPKVLYCNYAHTQPWEYEPYELKVVPQMWAHPEHFVISSSNVTHIRPGEPSEVIPLMRWLTDRTTFNLLRKLRYVPQRRFRIGISPDSHTRAD